MRLPTRRAASRLVLSFNFQAAMLVGGGWG